MNRVRCSACRGYFDRENTYWFNSLQRICSERCLDDYLAEKRRKTAQSPRARARWAPKVALEDRLKVHERDDYLCRACGGRGTQCHHVQYRSQGGSDDPSNLILLCRDCHQTKAHGDESHYYRELFFAYIWLRVVEDRHVFLPEIAAAA